MPFLLSILGYGRTAAQAVASWLSKRSFAELASLALVIVCLVEFVALKAEQRHANKLTQQLSKCDAARKAAEQQSKQQQKQVGKVIDHYVTVTKPEVRTVVQKVENAPLPGNCKTPQAVLEADV